MQGGLCNPFNMGDLKDNIVFYLQAEVENLTMKEQGLDEQIRF